MLSLYLLILHNYVLSIQSVMHFDNPGQPVHSRNLSLEYLNLAVHFFIFREKLRAL